MLIVMDTAATPDAVERVCERIRFLGYTPLCQAPSVQPSA